MSERHGVRVFERARYPQPAARIKGKIHRLANVRAGRDQFHPEAIRDIERLQAFTGAKRIALANQCLKIRPAKLIGAWLGTLRLAKRHPDHAK